MGPANENRPFPLLLTTSPLPRMPPPRSVIILAGGRGERFWPRSRTLRPKHLLPIVGDQPLLRQTVHRLDGLVPPERVWIVTQGDQVEACRGACPAVPADQVVAEPVGRDTGPAVVLAALLAASAGDDPAFAVLPADHVIHDEASFRADLAALFETVETEAVLGTLGIRPTEPATGYGYLETGEAATADAPVRPVLRFVEKPDRATAEGYLAAGHYLWNAGMFAWRPSILLAELQAHAPELAEGYHRMAGALRAGETREAVLAREFPALPKRSIDYALMEKSSRTVTRPANFDWDDVGSWPAVARHHDRDADGNVAVGPARFHEATGNIVVGEDGHLVGVVGVDDLVVVHTPDATLVCPRERAEEVKELVRRIGDDPRYAAHL